MREILVSLEALIRVDTLIAGTILGFDNKLSNSIIIDLNEIRYVRDEGNNNYFDMLSKEITFGSNESHLMLIELS
jgi:hypothetical protein